IAPIISAVTPNVPARTIAVRFSENVGPSIATTDLEALNRSTGQTITASSVTYNAQNNTAVFTFDALPPGVYLATLFGSRVADAAGNVAETNKSAAFTVRGGVVGRFLF